MKINPSQKKRVDTAFVAAKARQDEMWEQIEKLEQELAELNDIYKRAREVECNAINMLCGAVPFDEKKLELK